MGTSSAWKVYDAYGNYVAAFVDVYDAAQFVALEDGRQLRYGHPVRNAVWTQEFGLGDEVEPWVYGVRGDAGNSYDAVAQAAAERFPRLFASA